MLVNSKSRSDCEAVPRRPSWFIALQDKET